MPPLIEGCAREIHLIYPIFACEHKAELVLTVFLHQSSPREIVFVRVASLRFHSQICHCDDYDDNPVLK